MLTDRLNINFLSHFFSAISEGWNRRLENAQGRYRQTLELEKLYHAPKKAQPSEETALDRNPDGWLINESQSTSLPLFSGGNSLDGLELRLAANSVFSGGQTYSSNDYIEIGDQKYLIKLLPPIYRSENSPNGGRSR